VDQTIIPSPLSITIGRDSVGELRFELNDSDFSDCPEARRGAPESLRVTRCRHTSDVARQLLRVTVCDVALSSDASLAPRRVECCCFFALKSSRSTPLAIAVGCVPASATYLGQAPSAGLINRALCGR
jgi:hypothetical protein